MEHPRAPSTDPEAWHPDALARQRATVVRRLLDRGIRTQTLAALLPGWEHLLAEVERSTARERPETPVTLAAPASRSGLTPPRRLAAH